MSAEPDVDDIKQKIVDDKFDGDASKFDEDKFDEKMEEFKEKLGKYGDDPGFIAWAVADRVWDVKISSKHNVPTGSSSGPPIDVEDSIEISVEEIEEGKPEDDEQPVTITGYIHTIWTDVSDKGNIQKKFPLIDENGDSILCVATGEDVYEILKEKNVSPGDFLHVRGAQVFRPDEEDPTFAILSLGKYAEYEVVEDAFDLRDVMVDITKSSVSDESYVYAGGVITDGPNISGWEGCAECKTGWDEDEFQVCPKCGSEERKQYQMRRYQMRRDGDGKSTTIELSSGVEFPQEDMDFADVVIFGQFVKDEWNTEDDGTREIEKISVSSFEVVGDMLGDMGDETENEEEADEEGAEDSTKDEEENNATDDGDIDSEVEELVEVVEEKVSDFPSDIPVKSCMQILEKKHDVEDEEVKVQVMRQALRRGSVTIRFKGEDNPVEDAGELEVGEEWDEVLVRPKGAS